MNEIASSGTAHSTSRRIGCCIVILLVICAGAWWFWSRDKSAAGSGAASGKSGVTAGPVPVAVDAVKQEDFEEWVSLAGTITPLNTVTVRSLVDGHLDKTHFEEGQMVNAGDLIAEIDPRPYQVALDQARAASQRDEALLKNARADLARYNALLKENSIAEQQVATQASLVQQYEATSAADRAAIASAELQLSYTKITTPITGRAGLGQIDPGNMIHATDTTGLVIVVQMDPMGLTFSIPQERVAAVRKRLAGSDAVPVEVLDKEMNVTLGRGRLSTTDNQIDLTSGTLKLKAELPNADGALFPNQFVIAKLLVDSRPNATVAPATAIQRGAGGAYVFVLNGDSTVSLRHITTGAMHRDQTLILEGLKPGEKVVTQGIDRLRDGAKVQEIRPGPESASARPSGVRAALP